MNRIAVTLIALVLFLAPLFAAVPDEPVWSSWLCAAVLAAALFAVAQAWPRTEPPPFASQGPSPSGKGRRKSGRRTPSHSQETATLAANPSPLWAGVPRNEAGWASGSFLLLLGLALLSFIVRLIIQHSTAYVGLMLRGWGILAIEFVLFVLCRRIAQSQRSGLYALVYSAVFASAIAATQGVSEYALHALAHNAAWRVFGTSTPDFLAGYFVLLLPVTLALFLGVPSGKGLPLLLGLVIVLQTATLLTTGSRFALVSLIVAVCVFAASVVSAVRHGMTITAPMRARLIGIVVVVLLAGLGAAKPVLSRLHSGSDANSGAFRLWTWRGAARMAAANPLLGTGIGAWVDQYPRYALTGFTRLAHNSYLQMADECGIPALLVLATTLGIVGVAGGRGIKRTPAQDAPAEGLLASVAPVDDRLLLGGLLGALAAGVIQNLIDSDWYVFFLGITFWAVAGLAVGLAGRGQPERASSPKERPLVLTVGSLAVLGLALFGMQGTAAIFGRLALTDDTPIAAAQDDLTAQAWDPLDPRYPADLGWRVYGRSGRLSDAEAALRTAEDMEPSGTNARRLGSVLDAENDKPAAIKAYEDGLRLDPNSLDLRLALAQDDPAQALEMYRQMAALEDSPVGRVRAIGEITEVKFAIADAALGQAAATAGNAADALRWDIRAQRLLESYADDDGTTNIEQQALLGNHAAPDQDARMRDLYVQVMTRLAALVPPAEKPSVESRARQYEALFLTIIAQSNIDLAETAQSPSEAVADFTEAANALQFFADTGGSPDAQKNAEMSGLYGHVMVSLSRLLPPDQQAALQAQRGVTEGKFARLLAKKP